MPNYFSTRNQNNKISASQAIINGLSDDGGLFVPENLDQIHFNLKDLLSLSYPKLAQKILTPFLSDFSIDQINHCITQAYERDLFDTKNIVELKKGYQYFFLELYHGKTAAFKDLALSLLPHLLTEALKNTGEKNKILILTATSGDTGKAALEGFKDVPNTQIIVFYPQDGVSPTQKRQMITTEGKNTYVVGVDGNFDDTQNGVKEIFNDKAFKEEISRLGYNLSSANSINIGRLIPQIVYYYWAYLTLVREGEIKLGDKINFVVPSGNFGDILAGYYAKLTGLPVKKLICASNINHILTDFLNSGEYDINRKFYKTSSPSMDILISSNLERLLFDKLKDTAKVSELMNNLKENNRFKISLDLDEFEADYATEEEVIEKIKEEFSNSGNLIDPHTAVGAVVYEKTKKDKTPTVILATASAYKFLDTIKKALEIKEVEKETGVTEPEVLKNLDKRKVRHKKEVKRDEMRAAILERVRDVSNL